MDYGLFEGGKVLSGDLKNRVFEYPHLQKQSA